MFKFMPDSSVKGLYWGHTFVVTFPEDSVPATGGGCSLLNGSVTVGLTPSRSGSSLMCQYKGRPMVAFESNLVLTVSGLTFSVNFLESTSLRLQTNNTVNAVVLAHNNVFRAISVYNRYQD